MYRFEPARLISGRTTPVLSLADVYVAVLQSKFVGQLVKCLSAELPLGALQHLKRVKPADKASGGLAEVLLCLKQNEQTGNHLLAEQAPQTDQQVEREQQQHWPVPLPSNTAAFLDSCAAVIRIQQVPVMQPDTKEQWLEWCKVWPMPWRIPAGANEQDGESPSLAEQQYFQQHMAAALSASAAAGGSNVAIIVDPTSGQVLAHAVDSRDQHPLDHAVMKAIEQVAARDRRLWPFNGFAHTGRHAEVPDDAGYNAVETATHTHHSRSVSMKEEADHSRPSKKHKVEAECCTEGAAAATAADAAPVDEIAITDVPTVRTAAGLSALGSCQSAPISSTTAAQQWQPAGPSTTTETAAETICSDADWSKKPYLCTGYDCFVVEEPCYMCGMGLVHSRLSRVIFCHMDNLHGVLGGRHRLQAERTLNHHYKVYHMPFEVVTDSHGLLQQLARIL